MPSFRYTARTTDGQVLKGLIDANNPREAAAKLRQEGLFITVLQSHNEAFAELDKKKISIFEPRVKLRDILILTKQFEVMIKAGLNLANCLNLLSQQSENKTLARILEMIRYEVESGEALHKSMAKFPKLFPPIYIHMVEAGEASGQLDTVFFRLTQYLEREFELRKKVKTAMTYPSAVVLVMVVGLFVMMTVVLPPLLQIFNNVGIDLPLPTRILIVSSRFFTKFWHLVIIFLFGIVGGFMYYRKTPSGKRTIDRVLYGLKVIGPVIQKLVSARFSRTLATLMESGILITVSLEIVERAVGNTVIASIIGEARQNVSKGVGLSKTLAEKKVFPPMVTQMIGVGEETGELSGMLNQIADFYEKEAGHAVESLTTMIEPVLIILLGLAMGFVIVGILIPIFQLSSGAAM